MEEITLNEFQTSVCGGLDDSCSCSDQFSYKNEDLIKNLIKIFFPLKICLISTTQSMKLELKTNTRILGSNTRKFEYSKK